MYRFLVNKGQIWIRYNYSGSDNVPNPDPQHWLKAGNHHSHLGKVEESILGEVGSSLLYEGEVG